MTAITKQNLIPATKILTYLQRTGNSHTALEIAELMGFDVGTARRRITDIARHLEVVDWITEGVRRVRVYRAR